MKIFVLLCLLITSCSSWKQKDFEKSLEKPVGEAHIDIPDQDQKILQKFEVAETRAVVEETNEPPVVAPVAVKKVSSPKKVRETKKKEVAPVVVAPSVKSLPEDYPDELVKMNEKAKAVWAQYKPNHIVGQKVYLDIHYLGMTVGKIVVTNEGKQHINGKEHWHFHARFKSAPFYSSIYELDDTVDTHVSADEFLSVKYSLVQRESKQSVDDLQLHDRDSMKTNWYYKQKKSDGKIRNKNEKKYIPYFSIDPFSVLFLYQGLPLKDGDRYDIPVINKSKMLLLSSVVEGRETIETELGKKRAIRLHATTKYTGETLKSGDMYFWISDDAERKLLKAKAKIKIGSVTADIVKD